MEAILNFILDNVYVSALILVATLVYFLSLRRNYDYPPGPYCLPIVGYLPFLGSQPHETMMKLAQRYGNIFSLRLGSSKVVVLADYESVKQTFNNPFAMDRPEDLFHFMPDGMGLGSINGVDWTEQRRYTIKSLKDLGLGKSEWESHVQEEVRSFVQFLASLEGRPVRLKDPLIATVLNNVISLLFGQVLLLDDPRRKVLNRAFYSFAKAFQQTGLQCVMPGVIAALAKFGVKVGNSLKEDLLALNGLVRDEIKSTKKSLNDEVKDGYVYKYLSDMNAVEQPSFNEKYLAGNVQSYIFGGVETTMTTLHWLFMTMVAYPDIQRRVHDELDDVLGDHDDDINYSQRSGLPYTCAAILEIMRWKTLLPLNLLRTASEDIKVGQYTVPKGTVLLGLFYALHRDQKYWPEPEVYRPERFLDNNGKLVTRKESWVPFSIGKRNCPGEIIAMIEVFLYFVAVMRKFTVTSPTKTVDFTGILGIVFQPKDVELRFEARSSRKRSEEGLH